MQEVHVNITIHHIVVPEGLEELKKYINNKQALNKMLHIQEKPPFIETSITHTKHRCTECGERFDNAIKLARHCDGHEVMFVKMIRNAPQQKLLASKKYNVEYYCLECHECYFIRDAFYYHLFLEHNIFDPSEYLQSNRQQCVRPINDRELSTPIVIDDEEKCEVCGEVFKNSTYLDLHFKVHGTAYVKKIHNIQEMRKQIMKESLRKFRKFRK